jgi:DnaJ-class molecular chaperone
MALNKADPGFKLCPHCNGKTTCNCATCGIETTTRARGMGARWMEAGVCRVCNGHGQIIDPNYKRPESA